MRLRFYDLDADDEDRPIYAVRVSCITTTNTAPGAPSWIRAAFIRFCVQTLVSEDYHRLSEGLVKRHRLRLTAFQLRAKRIVAVFVFFNDNAYLRSRILLHWRRIQLPYPDLQRSVEDISSKSSDYASGVFSKSCQLEIGQHADCPHRSEPGLISAPPTETEARRTRGRFQSDLRCASREALLVGQQRSEDLTIAAPRKFSSMFFAL